ncbi:ZBT8B protein, partial [Rhodinocichla rosea]|nr:ZBT8B protein [Rhodinocichla rosea]
MEVQSYYAKLLGELNEQRKRDFFCDCSIIVEGRIFKAHKNILFANSGYFRALLIHYIQDSGRHSTASLDIVTSEAFSVILDFLYSGKLDLCGDNVIEVMSAASYLQMTDVVNFCKSYIRSSLDICRKMEREAVVFYQADSGSSARDGPSAGSKGAASVVSTQEKVLECQRDPPCGDCSGCHPLEVVARDPQSSGSPDGCRRVEPKVEFEPEPVPAAALEPVEEGQPLELACNNLHMKQFLEALLRNSSAPRKEDVVHHLVRGFEGRAEDAGVAVSSMVDIHSDWYGEDTGERTRGPSTLGARNPFQPKPFHDSYTRVAHIFCGRITVGIPLPFSCFPVVAMSPKHQIAFFPLNLLFSLQVHRSNKPIICKGCRRTFTNSLSQGLRRFGLCDSCTCVTTTHEDSLPINLSLVETASEGQEKGDADNDWPIYVESGEENDPAEDDDGDDKQEIHRSLSDRETLM